MIFAYADPPYFGQGAKHYGGKHERAGDFDDIEHHADLIHTLSESYPDGWALSASSTSLREILPICPADVRVLAWVKPFAIFKPNVGLAYAWEPVIFRGGRKRERTETTVRDWVSANVTLRRGLSGAKPRAFCRWIFDALNAQPGDDLEDLFPGTGAVSAAWKEYTGEAMQPGPGLFEEASA